LNSAQNVDVTCWYTLCYLYTKIRNMCFCCKPFHINEGTLKGIFFGGIFNSLVSKYLVYVPLGYLVLCFLSRLC